MRGLGYLIKEGLKNIWNNRIMSIASICVLVSCLVLTGSAVLFTLNVDKVVKSVEGSNETTFYLADNLSRVESVYIGRDIRKIKNVKEAEYCSKDKAIERYKKMLGEEIFERMNEDNPLPDAYIVKMKDIKKYKETVKEIMAIKGVSQVASRQETADRLAKIDGLVKTLSFWIVLALMIISLFIISNTIRATMHNRRFEISIMKSVGATNHFVRVPFVVEGMAIGLIAAVISTCGMIFLYDGIMNIVTSVIPFTAIPLSEVFLYMAGAFVVAGVLIGMVSGIISIRKYLRKEGNEILGW
ncbi:MAG: permease-like cell division protein FtsX [Ruminococcus sp.]|nr:permease-like cell division protein FtsX [Ruminococcus sp.]